MSQGFLPFTPPHCSVLDEPMPSCCILPVRFVLIPGHTAHCELHGPNGPLYTEHMKTDGWREALAEGRAKWIGVS